jgi:hypothetical protein
MEAAGKGEVLIDVCGARLEGYGTDCNDGSIGVWAGCCSS